MKKRMYKDANGAKYAVETNGGSRGINLYFCGYRRQMVNGVEHARIPKGLEWKKSWPEAQKDLDALAEKNGWQQWYGY